MTAASTHSPTRTGVERDEGHIPSTLQFLRIRDVCQMLRISKPTLGAFDGPRIFQHPRN